MVKKETNSKKIKKCWRSLTGKHYWYKLKFYTIYDDLPECPRCKLCGVIDDRKTNKQI